MAYKSLRFCQMAAILPLLLVFGCGSPGPNAPAGQVAPTMPVACLNPTPISDAGLTDAQRDQAYKSAAARGWQCYAAWIATLDPAAIPYSALGHTGMSADLGPADGNSLTQAKADASLVVSGTVLALRPLATTFGTQVILAVSRVFKGQAGATITINQASHLEPRDNYQNIVIVDSYAAPLLLPGDSVFLLLQSYNQGLVQETITGTYYVRAGQIQALQLNPFAGQENGLSTADFTTAIANA